MSEKVSYSGGLLVAKSLAQEDVKYVFSISGGHINPIYHALAEEGIKIITTRLGHYPWINHRNHLNFSQK